MRNKILIKRMCALAMCGFLLLGFIPVSNAVEVSADNVDELESERAQAQSELDALDNELVSLLTDINVLEGEIAQKSVDIENATANLEAAEQSVEDQYQTMKVRMQYMYENDQSSIIEILLEADSFSDFLNQVDYANAIHEQDRQMLSTYEGTVSDVTDLKAELENEQIELKTQESQLTSKETSLNAMIATKQAEVDDFDAQLTAAKEEAARLAAEEAARKAAEQERANAAAVSAATSSATASNTTASNTTASNNSNNSSQTANNGNSNSGSAASAPAETSNPAPTTGVSGGAVVSYAMQFVGGPYVWGGNSLTGGCDCSGFVVAVYSHFGINLSGSRNSAALRSVGRAVDAGSMQAGDIICYNGHVAIYTGGGTIVEAQDTAHGITSNRSVYCSSILAIRRVI